MQRGRGRGRGSGRGAISAFSDPFAETKKDLGLVDALYSYSQVEKPPSLYPHRAIPKRRAALSPDADERMLAWAEELPAWTRASAFYMSNPTARSAPGAGAAVLPGSAAAVRQYLSDILRTDVYPKELVAPARAPVAGGKRAGDSSGEARAARRPRQNSVGEDIDALAEREKAEGGGADANAAAAGGAGAPPRRRQLGEDEEENEFDDDGVDVEEDFNDYAERHDDSDKDDGDDGGREAEY